MGDICLSFQGECAHKTHHVTFNAGVAIQVRHVKAMAQGLKDAGYHNVKVTEEIEL